MNTNLNQDPTDPVETLIERAIAAEVANPEDRDAIRAIVEEVIEVAADDSVCTRSPRSLADARHDERRAAICRTVARVFDRLAKAARS